MVSPHGLTDLSTAIDKAIAMIEARKDQSRGVLVFLATDGLNDDQANPNNADGVWNSISLRHTLPFRTTTSNEPTIYETSKP
jgi:hypothetical protein